MIKLSYLIVITVIFSFSNSVFSNDFRSPQLVKNSDSLEKLDDPSDSSQQTIKDEETLEKISDLEPEPEPTTKPAQSLKTPGKSTAKSISKNASKKNTKVHKKSTSKIESTTTSTAKPTSTPEPSPTTEPTPTAVPILKPESTLTSEPTPVPIIVTTKKNIKKQKPQPKIKRDANPNQKKSTEDKPDKAPLPTPAEDKPNKQSETKAIDTNSESQTTHAEASEPADIKTEFKKAETKESTKSTDGIQKADVKPVKISLEDMKEEDILSYISEKYKKSKSVKQNVTKTIKLKVLETEKFSKGKMYLSKGRMLWEDNEPEHTLVLYDGKTFWSIQYPPKGFDGPPQVLKSTKAGKKKSQMFFTLLLEKEKLLHFFKIAKTTKSNGKLQYFLTPKVELNISNLVVTLDSKKELIVKVNYNDDMENETQIEFDHVVFDAELKDSIFTYKPPKDAQVTVF